MSEENNNGFKVNDKRLFDENGRERDLPKDEEVKKETPKKETVKQSTDNSAQANTTGMRITSFITSFVMQTLAQLGEIEAPHGFEAPIDPLAAKQSVDILRLLAEKTKGNLDKKEDEMLQKVLRRFADVGGSKEISDADNAAQGFVMKDAPKEEKINFTSFVMSLAMQAFMQLGEIKPPEGFNVPHDPLAAQQTIEILKMLEVKCKGNLASDEDWMLKDVLQRLQLSFVKAK